MKKLAIITVVVGVPLLLPVWVRRVQAGQPPPPVLPPVATFDAIATGLTVQFTDQSTQAPTAWVWDFGDGGGSTARNPRHAYAVAGDYLVTLVARNAVGASGPATQVIRVGTTPPPPPSTGTAGFFTFGDARSSHAFTWISQAFMPYVRAGDLVLFGTGISSGGTGVRVPWVPSEVDSAVAFVRASPKPLRLGIRTSGLANLQEIANAIRAGRWGPTVQGIGQTYEDFQGSLDFIPGGQPGAVEFAIANYQQQRAICNGAGVELWSLPGGNRIKARSLPYGEMARFCDIWMPQYQADVRDGDWLQTWDIMRQMMAAAGANPREFLPQNTTIGDTLGNALPGRATLASGAPDPDYKPWPVALPHILTTTGHFLANGATGWMTQYQNGAADQGRMIDMLRGLGRTAA